MCHVLVCFLNVFVFVFNHVLVASRPYNYVVNTAEAAAEVAAAGPAAAPKLAISRACYIDTP